MIIIGIPLASWGEGSWGIWVGIIELIIGIPAVVYGKKFEEEARILAEEKQKQDNLKKQEITNLREDNIKIQNDYKIKLDDLLKANGVEFPNNTVQMTPYDSPTFLFWKSNNKLCYIDMGLSLLDSDNIEILEQLIFESGKKAEILISKTIDSLGFINIDDILYYKIIGEKTEEQRISGGGSTGGGISASGAILGSIIAGPAGMLLGGRKKQKINSITSQTIIHDNRKVALYYRINKNIRELDFEFDNENNLRMFIPYKDYNLVQRAGVNSIPDKNNQKLIDKDSNYITELKSLKQLLDGDIITQDEFDKKKNEILNKNTNT
ncbi:MAG: SHOCT domain-containing protein [Bacilli bacterium]|nr:SHOCT domain-containing protein [Bacilli bacterium]